VHLLAFILGLATLATSARTSWHGIPVLWLIAAAVGLAMAAAVALIVRLLVRDIAALRREAPA
jgi:hypothetical protein